MTVPDHLMYTTQHEWLAIDGEVATVGITEHASEALGDVVFVSLPSVGATVGSGDRCGEVESTKSVSDLYAPVDGEVVEINHEVVDDPMLVNSDPYVTGWLFRVRVTGAPALLDASAYRALIDGA